MAMAGWTFTCSTTVALTARAIAISAKTKMVDCLDNLPIIYQKGSSRGFVAYFPARRHIMPRPFASPVVLPNEIRQQLQTLVRAASNPQALAFRCRLILHATACLSQRSASQGSVPLHSETWFVVESGGVVFQRAVASIAASWRLCVGGAVRCVCTSGWKGTTNKGHIRIVGRTRVSPWCVRRLGTKRCVNDGRVGPGLAATPARLNG
jgi:hypothetical protein